MFPVKVIVKAIVSGLSAVAVVALVLGGFLAAIGVGAWSQFFEFAVFAIVIYAVLSLAAGS